jgi:hypothetical protein
MPPDANRQLKWLVSVVQPFDGNCCSSLPLSLWYDARRAFVDLLLDIMKATTNFNHPDHSTFGQVSVKNLKYGNFPLRLLIVAAGRE